MSLIKGFGGGGGKGGGGGSGRVAVEARDSLRSKAFAKVLDLICEGEIVGLANGLKSIYLDETPLQNDDGTYNFSGVEVTSVTGTQSQGYIPGTSGVESENIVGVEVTKSVSVSRQITNSDINAARVRISTPQLTSQNTSNGDVNGTSVTIAIDVQSSGGSFTEVLQDTISGKTTSKYERSYRIPLTGDAPWNIRVRRLTNDSTTIALQNKTFWESYTEIIDAKLRYPNSAIVGIKIDSSQFSKIPTRAYDMKLLKVKVPSNYNPETRAYTGIWNGNFTVAWTDNPAWCFYDLLTNDRYGLGGFIDEDQIDKWALYTVARYCDELISDGFGGLEPRFTCNMYLQTRADAYKVMQDMASIFRGMIYWQSGAVTVSQDAPSDPVYLYTPANVIDGTFNYQGSSAKTRHTVALVTWNDPEDFYRQKVEYVENVEGIARYGIVETSISAIGCTSRSQANRVGRWLLYSEQSESEIVAFKTGLEGMVARPGQVIAVSDPVRGGTRRGGRVVSATTSQITVDGDFTSTGSGHTLSVVLSNGTVETRSAVSFNGRQITVTPSFTTAPAAGAIWVLESPNLQSQLFRVVSCVEADDGVEINALAHNPDKFGAIESDLLLQPRQISVLSLQPDAPSALQISESLYLYQSEVRVKITVSWANVQYATAYNIAYAKDGGNFVYDTTSTSSIDILNVTPGSYTFKVWSVNAVGNVSSGYSQSTRTIFGKTLPPSDVTGASYSVDANIGVTLTWTPSSDVDIDSYEVRQGSSWNTATLLGAIKGTAFPVSSLPASGAQFLIKAIDTSGIYSVNAASVTVTVTAASQPTITGAFAGENIVLSWNAVKGTFATQFYEIRRGTTWAGGTFVGSIKTTTFSTKANWGNTQSFWIAAIDLNGSYGTPGKYDAVVLLPSQVVVSQEVVDNNVLLRWTDATTTLPIDHYEVRRGSSWEAGTSIGIVSARFSVIFETAGNTYTYYVAGFDSAGNQGTPAAITATVNQPPDYVLNYNYDTQFIGTKSNAAVDDGDLVAPIDVSQTWQSHFTSRSWTTPQNQIDAGYPYYLQPTATNGYYEETIDYGAVLPATKITVTPTYDVVAGSATIVSKISVKKLVGDPWIDYDNTESVYVTDFRYMKFKITVTASGGDDVVYFRNVNVRFDVKLKNDAGIMTASSSDSGGTPVYFNIPFVDVQSITVTPQGTAARFAVYDFVDTANPTSFKVLLFDTAGNRVSGSVSWSVKGV